MIKVGTRVVVVANFDPNEYSAPIGLMSVVVEPFGLHECESGDEIYGYAIDDPEGPDEMWICRPGEIVPIDDDGNVIATEETKELERC